METNDLFLLDLMLIRNQFLFFGHAHCNNNLALQIFFALEVEVNDHKGRPVMMNLFLSADGDMQMHGLHRHDTFDLNRWRIGVNIHF